MKMKFEKNTTSVEDIDIKKIALYTSKRFWRRY